MKKLMVIIFFGIFLMSFVSASNFGSDQVECSNIGTFELDTNITIWQTCSDCTFVNISSIQFPDGTQTLGNFAMQESEVTYSFNFSDTSQVGMYYYNVFGDKNSLNSTETLCFEVTPTGSQFTEAQGLVLLGSLIILIIIASIICYLGVKSEKGMVQVSLISFSILILIFALGFALNLINTFVGTSDTISSNYSTMYILFTILLSAGIAAIVLYLIFLSLTAFWEVRGRR